MPKYVIWENVKAVLNKNHRTTFDKYLEQMEELGYPYLCLLIKQAEK